LLILTYGVSPLHYGLLTSDDGNSGRQHWEILPSSAPTFFSVNQFYVAKAICVSLLGNHLVYKPVTAVQWLGIIEEALPCMPEGSGFDSRKD
jgi:hypothetical protein